MFNKDRDYNNFSWEDLGDIKKGRPNLGLSVPVFIYRLLLYTMRDALVTEFGADKANDLFIEAGRLAGNQFCRNMLNKELDFNRFIAELQGTFKEQKMGILRVENISREYSEMTWTVAEDLDCSGLPFTDEVVCKYDEGFISGILEAYTGKTFLAEEIDCWASGDRVCRFDVKLRIDTE